MANVDLELLATRLREGQLDRAEADSGLVLDPAALEGLIEGAVQLTTLLAVCVEAAHGEAGVALREVREGAQWGKHFCLAVRIEDTLTLAVRRAERAALRPGHVWSWLLPWYRDLRRNRPMLERWAADPERRSDSIRIPIAGAPVDEAPREAELIEAIVAAPDDLARRLVYADWLLERGDPRGSLIQLQCVGPEDPEREAALIATYGERIAGEIAMRAKTYEIRRGLVEAVTLTAASLATHGERLLASQPITTVTVQPVNNAALRRLRSARPLRAVRHLRLAQSGGGPEVLIQPLGDTIHLGALEHLELRACRLNRTDVALTFGLLDAQRLRRLALWDCTDLRSLLSGLARNPAPPPIEVLIVDTWEEWSVACMGDSPAFAQLRSVQLRGRARDWAGWLRGPNTAALTELELGGVDNAAVHALGAGHARLRSLVLRGRASLDAEGLAELLRSDVCSRLETFVCNPTDPRPIAEAAAELPAAHPLARLRIGRLSMRTELRLAARGVSR